MPKTTIDYSKTVMYKIVWKDLNIQDVYVGQTTDFRIRKNRHKSGCLNEKGKHYNLNIYKIIRENGGWDNWEMIEIEKYPCNDSNEAGKRERYWYELNHATLNVLCPGRTNAEYWELHREELYAKHREYYQENKDKIKERKRSKINCECGVIYCRDSKARHEKTINHKKYINSV